MKIVAYKLYESVVHCHRPFKIATGQQDACRTLLLQLATANGAVAYGEAVPIPLLTDETFDGCRQTLSEILLPLLQRRDIWSLRQLHREMLARTRAKSARCAIDLAIHNLQARTLGISLTRLLGGSGSRFETNYSIGIEDLSTTLQLAQEIVKAGYRRIKLKVGLDPEADIETVRRVSEKLPHGAVLRLDANGGWDRLGAVFALQSMKQHDCPVELVEQPTPREDFDGLHFVKERTCYPIAADESVQTVHDARRLLQAGCVDVLNLKLMKSGGLLPALEIAQLARAYGCRLMVGGMVGESYLGVGAAAALASVMEFEYADLDADILLRDTPFAEMESGGPPLILTAPYREWDASLCPPTPEPKMEAVLLDEWED